jgi:hypothetical protein
VALLDRLAPMPRARLAPMLRARLAAMQRARLAAMQRARLGRPAAALPLAGVLPGGIWDAGRTIARERGAGGGSPLAVVSDGSIF